MGRLLYSVLIGSAFVGATAAGAQDWRPYAAPRANIYAQADGGAVDDVCSGSRAHRLEGWLARNVQEGSIDPYRANRIHSAIDGLEDKARHECREGDWRAVGDISARYDRVAGWIRAAGDRWRDRW